MQRYTTSCPCSIKRQARSDAPHWQAGQWRPLLAFMRHCSSVGLMNNQRYWVHSSSADSKFTEENWHELINIYHRPEYSVMWIWAWSRRGLRYDICCFILGLTCYFHTLSLRSFSPSAAFPTVLLRATVTPDLFPFPTACMQSFICPVKQFSPLIG